MVGLCRPVSLVQPGSPASKNLTEAPEEREHQKKVASEKIKDLGLQ